MKFLPLTKSGIRHYIFIASFVATNYSIGYFQRKRYMRNIRIENKRVELENSKVSEMNLEIVKFPRLYNFDLTPFKLVISVSISDIKFFKHFLKILISDKIKNNIKIVIFTDSKSIFEQLPEVKKIDALILNNEEKKEFILNQNGIDFEIEKGKFLLFNQQNKCLLFEDFQVKFAKDLLLKIKIAQKNQFNEDFMKHYRA